METLVLSIRDNYAYLASAKLSKEEWKLLELYELEALMPYLETGAASEFMQAIEKPLQRLKKTVRSIVITLPGSRVEMGCWTANYVDRDNGDQSLEEVTKEHIERDNPGEWSAAVIQAADRRGGLFVSGAGIPQHWVDTLLEGCQAFGLEILRIEPEPLAIFRSQAKREPEGILIDLQDTCATFTGFFPGKGIISQPVSHILRPDDLEKGLILFEQAAAETFGLTELQRIPILPHGVPHDWLTRLAERPAGVRIRIIPLPVNVKIDKMIDFMSDELLTVLTGALLGLQEEADVFGRKVNFVPRAIQEAQANERRQQRKVKGLRNIAAILIAAILIEGACIGYGYITSEQAIPPDVQAQYDATVVENQRWQQRNTIYQIAAAEDRELVRAIDTLAFIRPNEIKLTRIDINEQGKISIEGHGPEPGSFNLYVSRINNEKTMFQAAQLDKMASVPHTTVKSFVIQARTIK